MPLNTNALSAAEYATIKNWILAGAPDKTGKVAFATDAATRQKIYVTQQGCDLMAVIDASTNVIMRYISLGKSPAIEIAHCVRFTPDGKYAYVSFNKGQYLQKIDASTDAIVADMYLGNGSWNLFKISDDGKRMLLGDFNSQGTVRLIDLEKMEVLATYEDLVYPHGIANTPNFDTFWITSQDGNTIYKLNKTGAMKAISIDANEPNNTANTIDPHEVVMSPDGSKYFLTCQASNEIRVMDAKTDKLLKIIPVGTRPQEFALSKRYPYLFVSCEEDVSSEYPGFKGSIYVIDYNTMAFVKRISGPFYQLHGISVDDQNGKLYVVSRNISSTGPAPHHTSQCGGRNGYYSVYDINTLQPSTTKRFESTVDPYSADTRFKQYILE
jgi:YVTN family beta-propeller protein